MIGRKKEIDELDSLYEGNRSELVAVYGRRRVGKTFLINETFRDKFTFKHTALSNEGEEGKNLENQLTAFYLSLLRYGMDSSTEKPKNWFEAFFLLEKLLDSKEQSKRLLVFLDELPWLDSKKSDFIKAFEGFWNGYGCAKNNLMVVVCGSANSWIQNHLINSHGGLYDRVTYEIKLSPFNLKECEEFFKERGVILTRYDIVSSYMILGGIPYYLGYFKKEKSLAGNIDDLFFSKNAHLKLEFDRLFLSTFENSDFAEKIVRLLATRRKGFTRGEIAKRLSVSDGGNLTKAINALLSSDFIEKYVPFGSDSKIPNYRLIDPFCIFYLKFCFDQNRDSSFWTNAASSQEVSSWRGIAFENVCLNHVNEMKKALGVSGVITKTSSWNFNSEDGSGQIDLILSRNDNVVNMCEMKFYSDNYTVDESLYRKVLSRDEEIRKYISKKTSVHNTLVTTFGVNKNQYSSVFQNVIVLDDLFE